MAINGSGGDDHINGTNGDDIIFGNGGADDINAKKGDDIVHGGDGNDEIHGGQGNDTLFGDADNDALYGDDGNDYLTGGGGFDYLDGGAGFDTARYAGSIFDYGIYNLGGGSFGIVDHVAGRDGADVITGIERLVFGDVTIDLTHNNAPIAKDDAVAITEDAGTYSSGSSKVTDNDFDFEGNTLTVTPAVLAGAYGTLTLNANGTYTYALYASDQALAQGQAVQDSFTYTVSDGSLSDTGSLTFTITGANDAPVAVADTASGTENQALSIAVLANDSDVDNGAVLSLVSASGPAGKGSVGISGNNVTFNPGTSFDHLAAGATETVVLSYTIKDEYGAQSSSTVTVTVTGTNDGPVAVNDSASGTENQVLVIDVRANDSDVDDGAVLTITSASAPAGKGSVGISAGKLVFNPGTSFDHLAAGATETVTLNYTIQDEHGAAASASVTVTITGTNDAPVAVADTAAGTENQTLLVNVLANDSDVDDGSVLTLVSGSAPAGQGSVSVVGNQLQFNPGTAFDHLAVGETQQVVLTYVVEDQAHASASSTVTVTVTGTNDAPTIVAGGTTATGSATELPDGAPGENVTIHHASGAIAFADVDTSDTHSATATAQSGGYLGTFTLDPVNQSGDSVGWHFDVSDAALNGLSEGQVVTQTYTIDIDDGHGGVAHQDVTITLTGAGDNVPPVASDDAYAASGNVTLHVTAAAGVLANDSDDSGVGAGPGQTPVTAYDAVSAHGGTVTVNPDGSFAYTSAAGYTGTDSFTYTITDAGGFADTATVTVSVGASVWFIDNNAAGSSNIGTQDNPYTSIAAFNAAQGTADGPAPGETVYLRHGTGTYAEADGINLTNGQTLIGGGEDLVIGSTVVEHAGGRPLIVTTGGTNDGVDVALNNHVSGFDIGSTTGAGIADSNGSVGTLVVFDVGKSGAGQIVDIDQGGTINVTLNSAASTGSTGGAIDLNAIGGSFTVTGATSITGTQSGGGVDVTAGVNLGVSFLGGLTADTGAANAIRFAGNMGSSTLAIAGGLNVTTTTGTGLLVQNGGSVTVTGAGNMIAATGGSAVVISQASIGANGVTLQSVDSIGGSAPGILLDTSGTGAFTVTGIASIAGSGGAIANKTGADGFSQQGVGVYMNAAANVSLANMAISGNSNFGISGTNVTNFALTDSTVNSNGTSGSEASIAMTGLTGTASFLGDVVAGSSGDNLRIANSAGSLNLTIADSASDQAIIGTTNNAIGNDGINITTSGTAALTLLVDGVDFQGARGDLMQVVALGSSTQNLTISHNNFHNTQAGVGGGLALSGGGVGSNIHVDYVVDSNSFTGAVGTALNAVYTAQAGAIRGYIAGNTVGIADDIAGNQGSATGNGISVGLDKTAGAGTATYDVTIDNNAVYDIAQGGGAITLASSGGGAANGAALEATVTDNIAAEMGDFTFTALYAIVGGSGSGDFSKLGLALSGNHFDLSDADFGDNAIFLDQISSDAHFYFPGYGGSPDGEFNGGTASADLGVFFQGHGNVLIDAPGASFPGGVDAAFIGGATGDPLVHPPFHP
jgi:VCBS repeat-containing protein